MNRDEAIVKTAENFMMDTEDAAEIINFVVDDLKMQFPKPTIINDLAVMESVAHELTLKLRNRSIESTEEFSEYAAKDILDLLKGLGLMK